MLVMAALAVLVLVIVGVFFTGGYRAVGTNMVDFVRGTTGDASGVANETVCNRWCTSEMINEEKHYPMPTGFCHSGVPGTDAEWACATGEYDCKGFCNPLPAS